MNGLLRFALPATALGVLALACDVPTRSTDTLSGPTFSQSSAQGRYIVVLQDGLDPDAFAAQVGVAPRFTYRSGLTGFSAALPEAALRALQQNPLVRWVEPVKVFQLQVQQSPQSHKPGHNPGGGDKPCKGKKCPPPPPPPPPGPSCNQGSPGSTHDDISTDPGYWGLVSVNVTASPTWDKNPVDIDIAILDSGADLDHPDLCVHQAVSFDPFEPSPDDFNGHGTHTSGTAGARDYNGNAVGVAGTARIWTVKVCNVFGLCFGDAIVAGIDYVTANAAEIDVANMSLGGGGSDQDHPIDPLDCSPITGDAEHLAICNSVAAGVTYVVAAGNSGADAAGFVPAAYDEVITVSAMNDQEQAAGFSNFGADVDFIAPGVAVKSTWLNGGYNTISGTSMASPHGAGAAALYVAQYVAANGTRPSPLQVRNALVANGQTWAGQDPPDGLHPEPLLDVTGW